MRIKVQNKGSKNYKAAKSKLKSKFYEVEADESSNNKSV